MSAERCECGKVIYRSKAHLRRATKKLSARLALHRCRFGKLHAFSPEKQRRGDYQ